MLIDTHCHLNFPDYEKDLPEVLKRSREAGVEKIICASSNLADSIKAIEIAQKYPGFVFASIGIHPQKTDPNNKDLPIEQIRKLGELVKEKGVVAIGECGLDYSLAPDGEEDRTHEEQLFLFEEQIEIAKLNNLALIVHSRKSFKDTLEVLVKHQNGSLRGVLHCYSGGKKGIAPALAIGFYLGIDGNVTYDEGLQSVVKEIPLEKILLETDSPYLSPKPFRGKRNEPANIALIANCIVGLKNTDLVAVSNIISETSKELFYI